MDAPTQVLIESLIDIVAQPAVVGTPLEKKINAALVKLLALNAEAAAWEAAYPLKTFDPGTGGIVDL